MLFRSDVDDRAAVLAHRLRRRLQHLQAAEDVDVEDPAGILDRVGFEDVGCVDLRERVLELQPAVHAFGHIHEGSGTMTIDGTTYVNASICDEHYSPVNSCRVVDL